MRYFNGAYRQRKRFKTACLCSSQRAFAMPYLKLELCLISGQAERFTKAKFTAATNTLVHGDIETDTRYYAIPRLSSSDGLHLINTIHHILIIVDFLVLALLFFVDLQLLSFGHTNCSKLSVHPVYVALHTVAALS